MKIILIFILTFSQIALLAQDIIITKKPVTNKVDIDTLTGIKNKKLIFKYDTLYIINAYGVSELMRCASDLGRIKNLNLSVDELSFTYSDIEKDISLMNSNINSFTSYIKDYHNETDTKLDSIKADNEKINKNMESLSKGLNEVNKKIKAERQSSIGSKALFGAGGMIIGGLIFMLVSN